MLKRTEDTTAADVTAAYEAIVALGDSADLGAHAVRMRNAFQRRTGAFNAEDSWFEARVRAFWDDALATQGFGALAAEVLGPDSRAMSDCIARAHRGFFVVESADPREACLVDLWSGAELVVQLLDQAQALSFAHAEGAMDARVTAGPSGSALFVLPGAYHHPADALDPALEVLDAAKQRSLSTGDALDALMRMELVLRASSRVKASFAYRVEALDARRT
jgi:hypothetical protein